MERPQSTTRDPVLKAAVTLAKRVGYRNIQQLEVAKLAQCSAGSVTNAFGTLTNLKREVMRYAVREGIVEIIAQGLADGNPYARKAEPTLKRKAGEYVATR